MTPRPQAIALERDLPPPMEVFRRLQGNPGVFWLDSSLQRETDGRFSVMGCNPKCVLEVGAGDDGGQDVRDGIERLEAWLGERRVQPPENLELPFWGGAVGWFGYDLARSFEEVPETAAPSGIPAPDIRLAWHDAAFVWDHQAGRSWIVGAGWKRPAAEAAAELEAELSAASGLHVDAGAAGGPGPRGTAVSDLGRAGYLTGVQLARDAIARGEVYQVNLSHRFEAPLPDSPAQTYLRLRELNPAPFAFFQEAGEISVLGSSPERFFELGPDRRIRTFPIKGTRRRGGTPEEDAALRRALESSPKERAELLMIVDLLRNDLGRVCETGSIEVKRLYSLESYATVHHLVAEIAGRLRADVGLAALVRALMPGGSISGAPKVSALAVIDRLERHRRGVFTGAMGYLSAHGRMDLNIAIRTIVARADRAYFQVGSGIVWDSDPHGEYEETIAKGRALFAALGVAVPD